MLRTAAILLAIMLGLAACAPAGSLTSAAQDAHAAPFLPADDEAMETLKADILRAGVWRCHSSGGPVRRGLELGLFLSERKIPVEIHAGDWCASAAAIAVLGSPRLWKSGEGRLVFHGMNQAPGPLVVGVMQGAMPRWGVPAATVTRLIDMKPNDSGTSTDTISRNWAAGRDARA